MQLFYVKNIDSNLITLSEEESRHAVKVLRKTVGDTLHVVNGEGVMYKVEIINPNSKACTASIIETVESFNKLPYNLHIAIAPTKNIDRIEWFLEKSTEIGISEFSMLLTEHSERKFINEERLDKVIVSAMKQSVKAYKPKLNTLTPFAKFLSQDMGTTDCYIAHCSDNFERTHLKNILLEDSSEASSKDSSKASNGVLILIGPEGDFSDNEISMALSKGFKSISLGTSRLRTETAALFATSIVALNSTK